MRDGFLFCTMIGQPAKTLTIGGSDSGGAAGIQADLKTWTALGVYGMSAITAVTAQNSVSVQTVQFMPPELVAAQINAVISDYGAEAIKTGFVGRVDLVEAVAHTLQDLATGPLVVDPVLVNHKGEPMFPAAVANAYGRSLLPLAELATPNWREAALLAGMALEHAPDRQTLHHCARQLHTLGARHVLITGVSMANESIDWWYDGDHLRALPQPLLKTHNRHGSGDTLSAAVCAYLARGEAMAGALEKANAFVARAMARSAGWKLGRGHGPLAHFPASDRSP